MRQIIRASGAYKTDPNEIIKPGIGHKGHCEGWFTTANKLMSLCYLCLAESLHAGSGCVSDSVSLFYFFFLLPLIDDRAELEY